MITPDWPAPDRVRAASTERGGGVNQGPYAAFNLSARVGDDEARVASNRRALVERLGLRRDPHWLEQTHGCAVLDLDAESAGQGDGAVTSQAGEPCAVLTADCLPVLLCASSGRRVGVAHAGWRGLAQGVLAVAVECMGGEPADLMAWLGPAIGPAAYEVGVEVRRAFLARDPGTEACFEPNPRGRWKADLYALARRSLLATGVGAIYGGGFCTYTEKERFFSHRREAPCGRMATLIWLTD